MNQSESIRELGSKAPFAWLTSQALVPLVGAFRLSQAPMPFLGALQIALCAAASIVIISANPLWISAALWAGSVFTDIGARRKNLAAKCTNSRWLALRTLLDAAVIISIANRASAQGAWYHLWGAVIVALAGLFCAYANFANDRKATEESLGRSQNPEPPESPILPARKTQWARWSEIFTNIVDRSLGILVVAALLCFAQADIASTIAIGSAAAWYTITGLEASGTKQQNKIFGLIFSYAIGASILFFLIQRLPLDAVLEAMHSVGGKAIWAILPGPLAALTSALAVYILANRQIPPKVLLYVQVVSDGYNQVLPLAGLGGVPYKISVLSDYLPPEESGRVVLLDRILHGIPGPLISSIWLVLSVIWLDLPTALASTFIIASVLLFCLAVALLSVAFSRFPGRVTKFIAKKLTGQSQNLGEAVRGISRKHVLLAFLCKVLGQVIVFFDMWLLFNLCGMSPAVPEIALVAAVVTVSAVMFFLIPQQLGTNEASISSAFALLGLAPTLAIVFALLRRARQVVWALFGVALHGLFILCKRLRRRYLTNRSSP